MMKPAEAVLVLRAMSLLLVYLYRSAGIEAISDGTEASPHGPGLGPEENVYGHPPCTAQ
jgi:hypothetical protein